MESGWRNFENNAPASRSAPVLCRFGFLKPGADDETRHRRAALQNAGATFAHAPAAAPVPAPAANLPVFKRNLAVLALVLTTLMGTLDAGIVNVALPQLAIGLRAAPSATVWVVTAFLLAISCAVPTTSSLGDALGRKRLFLIGVPLFTLSSLGCALSPTLPALVACRAFQGLGTSVILAVTIPMYRTLFPPRQLGAIMGINAMTVALGTCAGPSLGGAILAVATWPWLFLINLPIGALAFALGWYAMPLKAGVLAHFDWRGSLLAGAGIAAFLLGMHEMAGTGTLWRAAALLSACAVLVVLFLRNEKRATRPLLPLQLWQNGVFTLSVATAFWSFFGQGVAFVALPFLFQSAYGATPLRSALLFTPWPFIIMLVAPISGRLADKLRPSLLTATGLIIYSAGLLAIALLGLRPPLWAVYASTGLAGLGFGIFQSPNNREMQGSVPIAHASSAAAVLNLNRTLAQSAGSGAVSVALVLAGATAGAPHEQARAATAALWVALAGAVISAAVSLVKLRRATTAR